ncbi:MAG: TonB-dependent receptor [Deltaproteobacteria bacterium]|nr:TonB-dependent receptor [Deltaproteobacteria bacterium]
MKKKVQKIALSFLTGMLLCFPAVAHSWDNTTAQPAPVHRLDEVIVTATRSEKSADEVSADVDVLSKQDIKTAPAANVDGMLQRFSGIDITRPSDMAITYPMQIAIRGVSGGNRVLFMVDGVPINSALTGFINPGIIQPESIERVEVVKGAFSSLYGSNAMGGVINIITKKRTVDGREATPFAAAGDYGYRESGTRVEAKEGKLSCSLDGGYRSIDNHYRNDSRVKYGCNMLSGKWKRTETDTANAGFREARLSGRFDYDHSSTTGLTLGGGYSGSFTGMGETTHLTPPRDRDLDRELYYLHAGGHTQVLDRVRLEARAYTNYEETDSDDENMTGYELPFGTFYRYEYGDRKYWGRDNGLQLKASLPWASCNFFTLGADLNWKRGYWRNRGKGGRVIDRTMDETMTTQALYGQNETELFERLTVTLGGRFDVNSESQSSFSPKLGLLYRLSDRISLRGSAGRAFRAPNLSELYMPTWQMVAGIPFESNPDLDPEVIWSYDLGMTVQVHETTKLELTGFYTDATDLITNVVTRGVMRYENLSKVTTDGFEAGIETAPLPWLTGYANYTYTHAVDKDLGRMGNTPMHRFNGGVQTIWRLCPQAVLFTGLDCRYTDRLFYQDRMTKNLLKLDAFTVVDLTVRLDLYERLGVKAVMTNVINENYEQHNGDIGPARSYWMKMECRF